MSDGQQICPACFALIPLDAVDCPGCGADLAALSARDYREKLIAALEHPLSEVRMRAIIALGWRGEAAAAEPLVRCALRHPVDVVESLEIIHSLVGIKDAAARQNALSGLEAHHPARAVRDRAARALAELQNGGSHDSSTSGG